MSDLTTTMPILAVPIEDDYPRDHDDPDYPIPAPGEHGHHHDDGDWGRHRGGARPPRALKVAAAVAGVLVVGVVGYSLLGSGSKTPSAGPPVADASTTSGAGQPNPTTPPASATSAPTTPTPTGTTSTASTSRSHPTTTASTSHTSTPSKTSSSSKTPAPSSPSTTPHPSTPPSTSKATTSAPAPPPPSSASPTFTSLGPGSSGAAVTQLQENLATWAKKNHRWWLDVKVTGTWNDSTTSAVEDFQDDQGTSPPDPYGIYGPATDKALRQAVG